MNTQSTSFVLLLPLVFIFLFSISWSAVADTHQDFLQCLSSRSNNLSSPISNLTYTSGNSGYQSILQSSMRNQRFSSAAEPFLIVTPLYESQIQAVIYCSRRHRLEMRVRSGGHDYEGLSYVSSSDSPFVILDLRNLHSITIDEQNSIAWVQAGATIGELYYNIAEKSRTLAFPAGVCPTVGVGGHFSGGGYGMISRKHGTAADHIIDARLIDVNGRILDRQSMGEDLFWAIRGGGAASFGVVVAWKITLVTVPQNVTVFNVTRSLEQNATKLVHRWQYLADKVDDNLLIRLFLRSTEKENPSVEGEKTIQASFTTMFLGGADALISLMEDSFPELGLVKEDCTEMSWIESILFFAGADSLDVLVNRFPQQSIAFKGKSDFVREPISEVGLEGIWRRLYEVVGPGQFEFTPYGGRMNEISESETPFPHRAGNIYMIHYVVVWDDEEERSESDRLISWIRRLYGYMAPYVSKSPRAAYLNYRDLDLGVNRKGNETTSYARASIWGTKYFKNNFKRLVQVKSEVDPGNFFRNEQSIPPLML